VDGRPRFRAGAVREWINRMRFHAEDLAKRGHFANDAQREEAVGHVRAGIAAYEGLLEKFLHNDPEELLKRHRADQAR